MGDRVSIQFRNGEWLSVALFSHWGGKGFVREAREYAVKMKREKIGGGIYPLDRLEPAFVILDFFLKYCAKHKIREVASGFYLGKDENDGDNGDNGNFVIDLKKALEDAKAKK